MNKIIKIEENESIQTEELHYKYYGLLDLISYLMKQKDLVQTDILYNCIEESKVKYAELEKLKSQISLKYLPEEFNNKNYNYSFDFNNNSIIYSI